jgi:D-alanyl-D-alanine carboxypeptidase (penicillin-binding protein 5/6)
VRRRAWVVAILVLASLLSLGARRPARTTTPTGPPPPPAPPKAWIVFDEDSGVVLDAGNDRTPMLPASVFKVLTALIAVQRLAPDDAVPVSDVAEGMPARKINMKAGQVWRFEDVLNALLLVSANDAAVAVAERVSGSRAGFAETMARTGQRLGLADKPALRDPAGLDDEFSWAGGSLISARDLAIVTRAAMAEPRIRSALVERIYRFHGGDGTDHRLLNHNPLIVGNFAGAIGVKTGYTKKAGHSLIGAATRDGRTLVAIVLNAPDATRFTEALIDKGFASPAEPATGHDALPHIVADAAKFAGTTVEAATAHNADAAAIAGVNATKHKNGGVDLPLTIALVTGLGVPLALLGLRRRAIRRQRQRRIERQRQRLVTWS